jgi:transmembrane sensor
MDENGKLHPPELPVGRDSTDERDGERSHAGFTEGRSTVDDLIIQELAGKASPFEEERLKRWRDASPSNEAYYQEMAAVWELTGPEPMAMPFGPPPVEEIMASAQGAQVRNIRSGGKGWTGRAVPWARWGLLAASVAAVGLGVQLFGPSDPDPVMVHRAGGEENPTVTLLDGSFARLAPGSVLREWDGEGLREVSLEGRAFFAVARDESRPFVVRLGTGSIRVLGTRFQVTSEGEAVETVVVDGLVEVSNDHGSVEVPSGTTARMTEGTVPRIQKVADLYSLLDWPEGTLIFQGTPLSQVAAEISRHFDRQLRVDSPELSQRRVTAWFQGEPFEAVVESVCLVTEALCRPSEGGFAMEMGGTGGPS